MRPTRLVLLAALPSLFLAGFFETFASADEAAPIPASASPSWLPADATAGVTLELPFTLQKASALPFGFSADALQAPFNLVLSYQRSAPPHHPVFVCDANISFPRYSLSPAVGLTPEITFGIKSFVFETGFDFQDQKTVSNSPFKGSQFDTWIVSVMAQVRYQADSWLTFGLDGRYAIFFKTQLANLEGFETDIDHENTLILSPWATAELPLQFRLKAQLDVDDLGSTAIASKEFALGIQSQTVTRLSLSLSRRFGSLGAEIRYFWVTGFRDATELAYQAPFYYRDFLLSPQTLTLGVSWYF